MAKDLEVKLRITADGKVAVQQVGAVDASLESLADTGKATSSALESLVDKGEVWGKLAFGTNELIESLGRIGARVQDVIALAEGFSQLKARLELAVEGFGDADQALADVQAIADRTGQALDAVGDLYVKVAGAAKALGTSQAEVATITLTVAQAMRVAGASGTQAEGAIQQFSQALTGGTLRAEEFNSVVEAAPYFADQLAKGLGVARDELKGMVDQGLISSRDLAAAVQRQSAEIGAAYGQLPQTVGQAMQRVQNALAAYVGGINEAAGVTETIAGAIGVLAENVELIGPAAAAVASGGLARLTQAGVAQIASIKDQIKALLAQRVALREQQAASLAAAQAAQTQAVAELAAAQASRAAALQRQAAARQQLADLAELTVFGEARAAGERQLSAANVQLAASEGALSAAQAKVASSSEAATLAMVGGAAKVGVLSRALSLLAGPGGILLATVAGFAAFALAQRDTKEDVEDLTQALDAQRAAFNELGSRGLQELIRQEEEHQEVLRAQAERLRETSAAYEEQVGVLQRMTAAQRERTGAEARIAELTRLRTQVEADLEAATRDLAASEESAAQARARLSEITPQLTAEEQQRAQSVTTAVQALKRQEEAEKAASAAAQSHLQAQIAQQQTAAARAQAMGEEEAALAATAKAMQLVVTQRQIELQAIEQAIARTREELAARQASGLAKRDEIEAIQRTLATLEAEAVSRRAVVAAAQEQAVEAQREIQQYGDQSAVLAGLITQRDRLRAAIAAEGAAGRDAAPLLAALAEVNARIADAARDAAEAIDRQIAVIGRELTIAERRIAVESAALQLDQDRARARGDQIEVSRLAIELMDQEARQAEAAAAAKREEAVALAEKARVMQIAAAATGDYTAQEQAAVQAVVQAAEAARLEAEAMAIGAQGKREATVEAERLANQERVLEQAMREAGIVGVSSMEEVRAAIARMTEAGEIEALGSALREAFAQGVLGAEEYRAALDLVRAKQDDLRGESRTLSIDMQRVFDQIGDDYGKFVQINGGLREIPGALQQAWEEYVAWMDANGKRYLPGGGAAAAPAAAPVSALRTSVAAQPVSTATTNYITVQIEGVLDVNDRATLESLARKLKPVFDDLARRGVA